MTIPKEIVEKMEQVNALMKEIDLWMDDNLELYGSKHNHRKYFTNEYNQPDHYEFADEPSGEEQLDGEYYSFYGTYYYPTEKGNYFCFEYWM